MATVREVSYEEVASRSRHRKGWSLSFGGNKSLDIFLEVESPNLPEGTRLFDFLVDIQNSRLPAGLHAIKALDEDRFFRITCDVDRKQESILFARSLFQK